MARKKIVQTEFDFKLRGGLRRGAGRPNLRSETSHTRREAVRARFPLHLSLHLREDLPSLYTPEVFEIFRRATVVARRRGLAIVHYSVQSNHIHFIVEAAQNESLESALKSFTVCFATHLNRRFLRIGPVFKGRFHMHLLKSPRETRHALRYVLLNSEKHSGEPVILDARSSGILFEDWKELLRDPDGKETARWIMPLPCPTTLRERATRIAAEICTPPKSWLLMTGWKKI